MGTNLLRDRSNFNISNQGDHDNNACGKINSGDWYYSNGHTIS